MTYVLRAFVALGVLFLGIAGVVFSRQQAFIAESERSTGQVVDMVLDPGLRRASPIVAYTWQGEPKTHRGAASAGLFTLEKGEEVPLFVHRSSGDVLIDTFGERWFVPSLLSLLGVAFVTVPLVAARSLRRSPH